MSLILCKSGQNKEEEANKFGFFFYLLILPTFLFYNKAKSHFDPKSKACAMHVLVNEEGNIAPFGLLFLTQVKLKKRGFNDEKN